MCLIQRISIRPLDFFGQGRCKNSARRGRVPSSFYDCALLPHKARRDRSRTDGTETSSAVGGVFGRALPSSIAWQPSWSQRQPASSRVSIGGGCRRGDLAGPELAEQAPVSGQVWERAAKESQRKTFWLGLESRSRKEDDRDARPGKNEMAREKTQADFPRAADSSC